MASFSWSSCKILMTSQVGLYAGTVNDIKDIPRNENATMSFVHEYSHFLQLISSLCGFRLFCELVSFGVHGALRILGYDLADTASGYHEIFPVLRRQPDNVRNNYPDVQSRGRELLDEATVLFGQNDYDYSGGKQPWEIDTCVISEGTYRNEPFCGIVTPSRRIRPITPGMLSEGLSRRIDQWIKRNHEFANHAWPSSPIETEYYNGIYSVLSQDRYKHNVLENYREEITAILCSLALATERPDKAITIMLERLALKSNAGIFPKTVGDILKELLVKKNYIKANLYNDVMDHLLHGPTRIMARKEFEKIYEQLKKIQRASNNLISEPLFFVDKKMKWDKIKIWMREFSLPQVDATDGPVLEIDGVQSDSPVTEFLTEVERVLL